MLGGGPVGAVSPWAGFSRAVPVASGDFPKCSQSCCGSCGAIFFCLGGFSRDSEVVLASLVHSSVLWGPFAYSGYLRLLPCVRKSGIFGWEGYLGCFL